ncbi:MAG TPA: TfuA domain-containing protein [Thermoanaerobaculia bacterium]|nr:TfuA domain-containing protein [Thermoanaerobaculia bacterium]
MTEASPGVIVFAGPCLAGLDDRRRREWLEGFELRPPAQRGDVLAAVARRPHTLVLLDGYYYTVGAVTHKELLYALEAGIRVFGAASMGALRAVEMAPFGMIGVGQVFAWFRDGVLDGDDEVAVLHAPQEMGYRPLTVGLVEIRAALEHWIRSGEIERGAAGRLIDAIKDLPFTERFPATVRRFAADLLGERGRDRLRDRLASHSVKRADAAAALALARRAPTALASGPPLRPRRAVEYFSFDREAFLTAPPETPARGAAPTLVEVWALAQVLHAEAPELVAAMRLRYLLGAAALAAGLPPSPALESEIGESLEERLRQWGGTAALPRCEVLEEARSRALSAVAESHWGGAGPALRALADRLGLPPGGERRRLFEALEGRAGYLPVWWMARAFLFSPAFPAALATAQAACEVRRRFEDWAEGRVIRRRQLRSLAVRLWACEEVEVQASQRGLLDFGVRSIDLYKALALIAPAELLRRPMNGYPRCREELRASRLSESSPSPCR